MKEIADFPGYFVSEDGKIFSEKRGRLKEKVCRVNENGYVRVMLYKDKKAYQKSAHRLVAAAFCDNPLGKPHVNHIDGDKQNNCAENLEWCTHAENIRHAIENNLADPRNNGTRYGEDSPVSKFTEKQIRIACEYIAEYGYDLREASAISGVSVHTLYHVATGTAWKKVAEEYGIIRPKKTKPRISEETVISICQMLNHGAKNKEIREALGVNKDVIKNIKRGESYSAISEIYLHNTPTDRDWETSDKLK